MYIKCSLGNTEIRVRIDAATCQLGREMAAETTENRWENTHFQVNPISPAFVEILVGRLLHRTEECSIQICQGQKLI